MRKNDNESGEWVIDLNTPFLEEDSIPPPPLVPTIAYMTQSALPKRDTIRMSKAEIRAAVPGVPDEDLVGHDSVPPPSASAA